MKKGFTLVELSIVLVIIGLLVGGVLVGQSLIDSAKINNFVRKVEQYNISTNLFKSKFSALPGDNLLFNPAGQATVDGKICSTNVGHSCTASQANSQEVSNFWKNLLDAKMLTKFDPKFRDADDWLVAYYGRLPDNANYFNFGGLTLGEYGIFMDSDPELGNAALLPVEALAIDKKMDDGLALKGEVLTGYFLDGTPVYQATPNCNSGDRYLVDYEDDPNYGCSISIKIKYLN